MGGLIFFVIVDALLWVVFGVRVKEKLHHRSNSTLLNGEVVSWKEEKYKNSTYYYLEVYAEDGRIYRLVSQCNAAKKCEKRRETAILVPEDYEYHDLSDRIRCREELMAKKQAGILTDKEVTVLEMFEQIDKIGRRAEIAAAAGDVVRVRLAAEVMTVKDCIAYAFFGAIFGAIAVIYAIALAAAK